MAIKNEGKFWIWERITAWKFTRKLMMVLNLLIYFVNFILVKIHANDLVFMYFHPFSLQIRIPHPSQLDEVKSTFYIYMAYLTASRNITNMRH